MVQQSARYQTLEGITYVASYAEPTLGTAENTTHEACFPNTLDIVYILIHSGIMDLPYMP